MILNERLQKEALPSRNSLHIPGKHNCFYSLQGIFTRNNMLLCFVLFCFPLGWDSDAVLESGFHPAWHFGQSLL